MEAEHLTACEQCARERDAHRRVLALSSGYAAPVTAPLIDWDTLARGLRAEGVIRASGWRSWIRDGAALRAAAAVLLLVGGIAIGRRTAQRDAVPAPGSASALPGESADVTTAFASPAEAQAVMMQAQQTYQFALAYLQSHDSASRVPDDPAVYRSRLAALDAMADVAREAVNETPHDPVINRYYLTTLNAREVTLQQLGERLPDGERIARF